jgi:ubiquinone/menaquinone biosynthesis C-methylase UbiE
MSPPLLKALLHRIMSRPAMYDCMQRAFGVDKKKQVFRRLLTFHDRSEIVVDVGGGTGLYKDLWPAHFTYICLDSDTQKLRGFADKYPGGPKICSDAGQLCLRSDSVDNVFCSSMSHHVERHLLERIVREMARVIKPGGLLVFIDAVWIPESRLNRFLWSLDPGEHPHAAGTLETLIAKYATIEIRETLSIYYDYVLFVARKS